MKRKFVMKTAQLERGDDGLYRHTFGVYEGGTSHGIAAALTAATKQEWLPLGCFMDVACVGTRSKPLRKQVTVQVEVGFGVGT